MFDARPSFNLIDGLLGDELEVAWKDWAKREELRRSAWWFVMLIV